VCLYVETEKLLLLLRPLIELGDFWSDDRPLGFLQIVGIVFLGLDPNPQNSPPKHGVAMERPVEPGGTYQGKACTT